MHLNPFITYREAGPETSPDGGLRGMLDMTAYAPVDLELEEKNDECDWIRRWFIIIINNIFGGWQSWR